MTSSTDVVFHGRKASSNGFPLFVNTEVLAATYNKVAGCFTKVPKYVVRFTFTHPIYESTDGISFIFTATDDVGRIDQARYQMKEIDIEDLVQNSQDRNLVRLLTDIGLFNREGEQNKKLFCGRT